jgi:hypothetical protein
MIMKTIRINTIVALILVGLTANAQQQPRYSQYMFNMLNINPAYAGNREAGNLTMLLRKQWVGFPGAPTTGAFSYDQRVADKNFSWGAQMYFDKLGIESRSGVQGFYSYSAPLQNATLSIGMSMGLLNYRADYTKTNPLTPGDVSLQSNVQGLLPTAGLGGILSSDRWYVGLSMPALLKTQIGGNGQSVVKRAGADGHFFLTGGYIIPLNEELVFKPSVMFKSVAGTSIQTDLNVNLWMKNLIGVGLSYRAKDAVVGLAELQLKRQLRLGYSFDFGISKIANYNKGTHEIMLRFELGQAEGKTVNSPRYF